MAFFQLGKEITNNAGEPPLKSLAVDGVVDPAGAQVPLAVGGHIFELVVVDDAGNSSQPVRVRVVVVDKEAPTAVIVAPDAVPFGKPFTLDGSRSSDVGGGQVVRWIWKLVD